MSRRTAEITPVPPSGVPAPSGLSPWAVSVWAELTGLHRFEAHERITFERALRWWDRSDAAAEAGDMKLSIDASSAALRHWRILKFPTPAARPPGRPAGPDWSAKRRANTPPARY